MTHDERARSARGLEKIEPERDRVRPAVLPGGQLQELSRSDTSRPQYEISKRGLISTISAM
jgi:hypothetical protein